MKKNDSKDRVRHILCSYYRLSVLLAILSLPNSLPVNTDTYHRPDDKITQQKQQHTIKGRVTDSKNIPLPGVTVMLNGSSIGAATDNDGNFSLTVPELNGTLSFSFVGYKPQKISFTAGKTLIVKMEEDIQSLDEVRVVAYGKQSKRDMVGAMSVIRSEDLKDIPSASVVNLLQGKVPGMNVTTISGGPGGVATPSPSGDTTASP